MVRSPYPAATSFACNVGGRVSVNELVMAVTSSLSFIVQNRVCSPSVTVRPLPGVTHRRL